EVSVEGFLTRTGIAASTRKIYPDRTWRFVEASSFGGGTDNVEIGTVKPVRSASGRSSSGWWPWRLRRARGRRGSFRRTLAGAGERANDRVQLVVGEEVFSRLRRLEHVRHEGVARLV